MDVSVFIGNKRRFWSWILIPLVIRFAFPAIVFSLTSDSLDRFDQEAKAQEVLPGIENQIKLNQVLLEQYKSDPIFPVNEQLYKTVVEINTQYSLSLKSNIDEVREKRGRSSKVELYKMDLDGYVPSAEVAVDFIADLQTDPLLSLRECEFRKHGESGDEEGSEYSLSCKFEKLALQDGGAK